MRKSLHFSQEKRWPSVTANGQLEQICNFLESPGGDNVYLALAVNLLSCIAMDVMATNLRFSFMLFAITVMAGTFCSFISLVMVSYQTNLMVFRLGE